MNNPICPVCRRSVEPGLHGMRLECKCWVHPKCLDQKNPDFEKCAACKGEIPLNVAQIDESEPDSFEGVDYILEPPPNSFFRKGGTGEPFKWIQDKSPLEWIIRDKKYGLQRMLYSGVKFEHFLNAGYTWNELKAFKDFGKPERIDRAREALYSLKLNAEQLRDYPHLVGSMVQDLKITGRNIVELYGLQFPVNSCKPLYTRDGKNDKPWNAGELVKLGFKMTDILGAGLEYLEQYALLMPTDEDELNLEVTDEDIKKLPSLTEMEKQRNAAEEVLRLKLPPRERGSVGDRINTAKIQIPKVEIVIPQKGPRLHGLKSKK